MAIIVVIILVVMSRSCGEFRSWWVSETCNLTLLLQLEPSSSGLTVSSASASEARRSPNQLQLSALTSVSEEQSSMDFAMDFSGTLFSTFNQMFPDPKEMCN